MDESTITETEQTIKAEKSKWKLIYSHLSLLL
jgi:hypothetical protein